ncbi:MAG: hypothetical protein FGM57_01415 [Candidatus Taylorbacteria bacterium]|nr:hypothetical protein [Candidatus Taylorbacteria bacterium]
MVDIDKKRIDVNVPNSPLEIKKKKRGGGFFKLLFLIVLAGFVYSQYQLYQIKNPSYQQKLMANKNSAVLKNVSKLMVLPAQNPEQILYVQDAQKLKEQQAFFRDVQNDDAVLIYKELAIVYSPSRHKIINVGPIIAEPNTNKSSVDVDNMPKVEAKNTATTTKR